MKLKREIAEVRCGDGRGKDSLGAGEGAGNLLGWDVRGYFSGIGEMENDEFEHAMLGLQRPIRGNQVNMFAYFFPSCVLQQ